MISLLEKSEIRKQSAPISLKQYHFLIESGFIDKNLELLEGALIEKMSKSPLHVYVVNKIFDFLAMKIPDSFLVRSEQPITILESESEPKPDLAIIEGKDEDFIENHPHTAKVVIEVAISSLALDIVKTEIYAKANIPEYLVFDGANEQIIHFFNLHENVYTREEKISFSEKVIMHEFPEISFYFSDFWPKDRNLK